MVIAPYGKENLIKFNSWSSTKLKSIPSKNSISTKACGVSEQKIRFWLAFTTSRIRHQKCFVALFKVAPFSHKEFFIGCLNFRI